MKILNSIEATELQGDFPAEDLDYLTDMTVPNQSLTVQEIMERFTRGQSLPDITRRVSFDGSDDFDSIDRTQEPDYDLSDATIDLAELKADIDAKRQAKKRAKDAPKSEDKPLDDTKRSGVESDGVPPS